MKIILFIGHHKVGSSALQDYLARHAVALMRQGVLYPAVEARGLARLTSRLPEIRPEKLPGWRLPIDVREAHNGLAFRMLADRTGSEMPPIHGALPGAAEMFATIRRQVEMFAPRTVILAAEVFANFATAPELIGELMAGLPPGEVRLTATLRRPDDYMASWHGQRLRFGHAPKPLPKGAMRNYFKSIHFDYRMMLEPWIAALPEATLALRPYDAVIAAGGSVQDLMDGAGLPLPADPGRSRHINKGLHRGLIEIGRRSNAGLEKLVASRVIRQLLDLGPQLDLPRSGDVELYGAEARARMVQRFTPIHRWLSDLAGGPFFADVDAMSELRPYPEFEVAGAALAQIRDRHLSAFPAEARPLLQEMQLEPNFA